MKTSDLYLSSSLVCSISLSDDVLESESQSNDSFGVDQEADENIYNREKTKLLTCSIFPTYMQS